MTILFPKWTNKLPQMIGALVLTGGGLVTFVVGYWFSPKNTDVGYAPEQPIAYSHKLHAGLLGLDCRHLGFSPQSGWVWMNLEQYGGLHGGAWVVPIYKADGRYSAGIAATQVESTCQPNPIILPVN